MGTDKFSPIVLGRTEAEEHSRLKNLYFPEGLHQEIASEILHSDFHMRSLSRGIINSLKCHDRERQARAFFSVRQFELRVQRTKISDSTKGIQ